MKNLKLSQEIIALSVSNSWDEAKLEWKLVGIYFSGNNCLCGHEIVECCVLRNQLNNLECVVGNVCVNKFLGIESNKLFDAFKKIKKDITKSLNAESILYAYEKEWINDWDRNFYSNTLRKRLLTEKQSHKRQQINRKIIHYVFK